MSAYVISEIEPRGLALFKRYRPHLAQHRQSLGTLELPDGCDRAAIDGGLLGDDTRDAGVLVETKAEREPNISKS